MGKFYHFLAELSIREVCMLMGDPANPRVSFDVYDGQNVKMAEAGI